MIHTVDWPLLYVCNPFILKLMIIFVLLLHIIYNLCKIQSLQQFIHTNTRSYIYVCVLCSHEEEVPSIMNNAFSSTISYFDFAHIHSLARYKVTLNHVMMENKSCLHIEHEHLLNIQFVRIINSYLVWMTVWSIL